MNASLHLESNPVKAWKDKFRERKYQPLPRLNLEEKRSSKQPKSLDLIYHRFKLLNSADTPQKWPGQQLLIMSPTGTHEPV